MAEQAIGVFDSGVGGLSVLKHIHDLLPHEDLIYFADSQYAPYGSKTSSFIIERTTIIANALIAQGTKALVVACNTATAAAISHLRQHYALPIIGMEPAVKPAAIATKTGVVGVLATGGTLKSAQFAALLENYGQHIRIVTQACEGLVECIERGELAQESTKSLLMRYLMPLLDKGADTIVLGCTHYPFVRPLISEILLESGVHQACEVIDTGAAVAKHLQHRLAQMHMLAEKKPSEIKIYSNHPDWTCAQSVIRQLWATDAQILPLAI